MLDILLRIYVFFPSVGAPTAQDATYRAELLESSQSLLAMLLRTTPTVFDHPVCSLWTDCQAQPSTYYDDARDDPIGRRAAWRRVPRVRVKRRLAMIVRGSLWNSDYDINGDVEAYSDLIEFTR